jgi:hypothetical protein
MPAKEEQILHFELECGGGFWLNHPSTGGRGGKFGW